MLDDDLSVSFFPEVGGMSDGDPDFARLSRESFSRRIALILCQQFFFFDILGYRVTDRLRCQEREVVEVEREGERDARETRQSVY